MVTDSHDGWVERLKQVLATGLPIEFEDAIGADVDSKEPWPAARRMPAAALRAALGSLPPHVDSRGLIIHGVWIDGAVDLGQAIVSFPISFARCVLEGGVMGQYCVIKILSIVSSRTGPIMLDDSQINGSLTLRGTAASGVSARRAVIGGLLDLVGSNLNNPAGHALNLYGADIKGGVVAVDVFNATGTAQPLNATGEVQAIGATIDGPLILNGAVLSNPGGVALILDRAVIKGGMFAGDGFSATGEVRALGATIGGPLNFNGAILNNRGGVALKLDRADIKGSLSVGPGFSATGEVRALGATIGGDLILDRTTLSNPQGAALNLERAKIGTLRLRGITSCEGTLDLTACQIGDLIVDYEQKGLPRLASAAGWQIRDIHGALRHDRAAAIKWLDTSAKFTASPWEETARIYDRNGQPADARRVRFAAARRTARHAPGYSKLIHWFYALTVGYGYYPLIAAAWLLGAVLLAATLTAKNPDAFLPTGTNARATVATAASLGCPKPAEILTAAANAQCLSPGYPELNAITYALATVSPASAITQPAWAPLAPGADTLEATFTILKLLGWLLTVLLLAGLTGLLRKG